MKEVKTMVKFASSVGGVEERTKALSFCSPMDWLLDDTGMFLHPRHLSKAWI